jgi:hypothetical protein
MPKPEDIVGRETRTFLAYLRDALGQPPLDAVMATVTIAMVRLLAEQDIGKRLASRDHLDAVLAELDGNPGPARDPNPPLITRPHDWPHDE